MIRFAAGLVSEKQKKEESGKTSLFSKILQDYVANEQLKTQIQIDFVKRTWEFFFRKKSKKTKNSASNSNEINSKINENKTDLKTFEDIMKSVKIDDLSSPCCDLYTTRVLEIINKKPSDWPSPTVYKVCNTPLYNGLNYKDFYSSKWEKIPSEGWNVMIMWANVGEKFENSPHMAILQKNGNTCNLTHFTGNEQKIRENWSLSKVITSFAYSNFRYMSLEK